MAGTKYYATVENKSLPTTEAGLGSTNTIALQSAFPQSPIYLNVNQGGIDANEREEYFKNNVLDNEVQNGNGFASFNRDYSENGMPDIPNITEDNAGNPLYSPYIPNPTSPGVGSLDPNDKPMHNVTPPSPIDVANKQFGVGFSGVFNPLESAGYIESQGVKREPGVSSLINEI